MIKAYASYFSSYLMLNLSEFNNIEEIILYGSVARGDSGKESDVDIFIEVKKNSKKFEKDVEKILSDFYKSREGLLFKSRGITNKINLIIGKLSEWNDLKESMISSAIVLYGKFTSQNNKSGRKYSIFYWDGIDKNRGAFLNKVYGFNVSGKKYEGKKLGKSSLMIPIEHRNEMLNLFKHHKVNAKVVDVYM